VDLLRRTVSVVEQLSEVNGRLAFGPPKTTAGRRSVSVPPTLAATLDEQLEQRSWAADQRSATFFARR
jgi:hypothetical protein